MDLPSKEDRKEIFKVLLARYGRNPDKLKLNLDKLAEKSEGFTGAEIEQVIIAAMYSQFNDNEKEINQTSLLDELVTATPLSVTNKEELEMMRSKAVGKLKVASSSGSSKLFEMTEASKAEERNVDMSL